MGSGAGGGVVAGELAERGRKVLLLEVGPHLTAADFTRWEAKANHDFWWPLRFALIDGGAGGVLPLMAARCVGGTTTVNTKVALRAHAKDFAKWHEASGLAGQSGSPFGTSDLARTTTASKHDSASASAPTGRRASTPSQGRSARSATRSSRCGRTRTRTA